jgi:hypothetical protein
MSNLELALYNSVEKRLQFEDDRIVHLIKSLHGLFQENSDENYEKVCFALDSMQNWHERVQVSGDNLDSIEQVATESLSESIKQVDEASRLFADREERQQNYKHVVEAVNKLENCTSRESLEATLSFKRPETESLESEFRVKKRRFAESQTKAAEILKFAEKVVA